MPSQTYTTPGDYTWAAPAGVSSLTATCNGSSAGGSVGGGGVLTQTFTYYPLHTRSYRGTNYDSANGASSPGSLINLDGTYSYVGDTGSGDFGNASTWIKFDIGQINADIGGATIITFKLHVHNNNTYYSSGQYLNCGYQMVGTYGTSRPSLGSHLGVTDFFINEGNILDKDLTGTGIDVVLQEATADSIVIYRGTPLKDHCGSQYTSSLHITYTVQFPSTYGAGGGGGGGWATGSVPVTAGTSYPIHVPAGGTAGSQTAAATAGDDAYVTGDPIGGTDQTVRGGGGQLGAAATATSDGTGGAGGTYSVPAGGSGFSGAAGAAGTTNGSGGAGGAGADAGGSAAGGAGGAGSTGSGGGSGAAPGGGGGGGFGGGDSGGAGADGKVVISWTFSTVSASDADAATLSDSQTVTGRPGSSDTAHGTESGTGGGPFTIGVGDT